MDFREIVGLVVMVIATSGLWVAATQDQKDPIRWSGYVVSAAIGTVLTLLATVAVADKFANYVGDRAFVAGCEAAAQDAEK